MKIRNPTEGRHHRSSGHPPTATTTDAAHGTIDQPSMNAKKYFAPINRSARLIIIRSERATEDGLDAQRLESTVAE